MSDGREAVTSAPMPTRVYVGMVVIFSVGAAGSAAIALRSTRSIRVVFVVLPPEVAKYWWWAMAVLAVGVLALCARRLVERRPSIEIVEDVVVIRSPERTRRIPVGEITWVMSPYRTKPADVVNRTLGLGLGARVERHHGWTIEIRTKRGRTRKAQSGDREALEAVVDRLRHRLGLRQVDLNALVGPESADWSDFGPEQHDF